MNKSEFLESLRAALSKAPSENVEDILYDYSEHIDAAVENGESEEEVIEKLGDVSRIARLHGFSQDTSRAEEKGEVPPERSLLKKILAVIGLFFLNISIGAAVFFSALGVIIAFAASGAGIFIGGMAVVVAPYFPELLSIPSGMDFGTYEAAFMLFLGAGMVCLGSLMAIVSLKAAQMFAGVCIRYFKWNIKVLRG